MKDEIDVQTYVILRTYIETGAERFKRWQDTGVWPEVGEPPTAKMINLLCRYIPAVDFPLTAEESALVTKLGNKGPLPAQLRRGEIVFRSRDVLIQAINAIAPNAAKQVGEVPGSDEGGIEWWAVALSAAGALHYIGKLNWQGALVSVIVSRILMGVVAYMGVTAKTDEGKYIVLEAAKGAGEKAANAINTIGDAATVLIYGAAGAVVLGLVVYAVSYGRSRGGR